MGHSPNDIVMNETHAFVMDYGNNTIHRISLETLDVEKNFVDLGQNAGPASGFADEKNLYIVCNMIPQVVKVDLATKKQEVILDANYLKMGSTVVKAGNSIVVADSEYEYKKTEGKLVVITEDGSIRTHKTATPNPTYLNAIQNDDKQYIVSANSGELEYDADYNMIPPEQSCIQLWDMDELVKEDAPTVKTHCETNAYVGKLSHSESKLYVGDGLVPKVYAADISKLSDFDTWSSMDLSNGGDLNMTIPLAVGEDLAVFNFNNDSLTWLRGDKRLTLKLSQSEASKKGPLSAIYDSKHKQILVLNTASGSVDVLSVK